MLSKKISSIGVAFISYIQDFGNSWLFVLKILLETLRRPYEIMLLMKQLYAIGFQSISVVALVGGFTGAVLAVQGEYTDRKSVV